MVRSSKKNVIYICTLIILFTLLISGTGAEEADSSTRIGMDTSDTGSVPDTGISETSDDATATQTDGNLLDLEKQKMDIPQIANDWRAVLIASMIFIGIMLLLKITISKIRPSINVDHRVRKSSAKKIIRVRPVYVKRKIRVIIPDGSYGACEKPGPEASAAPAISPPVDSRPRSDMRFVCINGRVRDRSSQAVN